MKKCFSRISARVVLYGPYYCPVGYSRSVIHFNLSQTNAYEFGSSCNFQIALILLEFLNKTRRNWSNSVNTTGFSGLYPLLFLLRQSSASRRYYENMDDVRKVGSMDFNTTKAHLKAQAKFEFCFNGKNNKGLQFPSALSVFRTAGLLSYLSLIGTTIATFCVVLAVFFPSFLG